MNSAVGFIDKREQIKALAKEIQDCADCYEKFPEAKDYIVNTLAVQSKTGINPWTDAFPNYNAKLVIVGQDWGSEDYLRNFLRKHGGTIPEPYEENNNKTWTNLIHYLDEAAIYKNEIYLTNALLCLRKGKNISGEKNFSSKYLKNCLQFLIEQIEIIKPLVIAALGEKVFRFLLNRYMIRSEKKSYENLVEHYAPENYRTETGITLYPLFHTGYYGVLNRGNRKPDDGHTGMIQDFKRLKMLLDNIDE